MVRAAQLSIDVQPDRTRITLAGEIDMAVVAALREQVEHSRAVRTAQHICVDLSQVQFLDVLGLNMLIRWRNRARPSGARFEVVHPRRQARRLIEVAGLTETLLGDRDPS